MYRFVFILFLFSYPALAQQQYDFLIDNAIYNQSQLDNELLQYNQRDERFTLEYAGVKYNASLSNNLQYDTNIFSVSKNSQDVSVEDDFINTIGTSFSATTDLRQHNIGINAGFSDQRYISHSDENAKKYNISGFGKFQISETDRISLGGVYNQERENRDNVFGSQISQNRILMRNTEYNLTYDKVLRRTRIALKTNAVERNFEDGVTLDGQNINQSFRNFKRYAILGRVDYAISPELSVLALVEGNKTSANNNSQGSNYAIGTNVNITNFINLETKIGYFIQSFNDASLRDTQGLLIDSNLSYYVTPLTNLSLNILFDRDQQASLNANDTVRRYVNAGLEHKLTPYITLSGNSEFTQQDFGSARVQSYQFGLGGEYLIGDHIYLTLKNRFSFQQTEGLSINRNFKKNTTTISLKIAY